MCLSFISDALWLRVYELLGPFWVEVSQPWSK